MLTKQEFQRYSRHILLPEIGTTGQEKLKKSKVLVIGAGGLGCPVLQYLAAAGVGTIGIVDFDIVEESNLQRQILFNSEDVGKLKAEVAAKKLKLQNPFINITTHNSQLTTHNSLDIIKEYDIVVDGSDNFPTRYLVNDSCVMLNKILVFGSIFKFQGQVSVFNYKNGPTYRCLFPEPPREGDVPNCSEIGVIGVLPGIIGTFMANEALKIILEIGNVLYGKLLVVDSLSLSIQTLSFKKNEANANIKKLIDYDNFCNPILKTTNNIVKEISVFELKKKLELKEDIQIIDVREANEYDIFNIKGENISLGCIEKEAYKISKTKQIIIHCQSGVRSQKAIKILEEKFGFQNLYNLTGGLAQWKI